MTPLAATDELFYARAGLDRNRLEALVNDAMNGADDGELFLEHRQSEALAFDDGRLKSASLDKPPGFGPRAIAREAARYAPRNPHSARATATARAPHHARRAPARGVG